jgi:hypothetical protein
VRGRDRLTTWDGHVELSEGRILEAATFAMENPEKGIVERTGARVRFVSNTTGDDDGLDVTLDAPAGAVIRFRTPVIDLDVPLADLHDHLDVGTVQLRELCKQVRSPNHEPTGSDRRRAFEQCWPDDGRTLEQIQVRIVRIHVAGRRGRLRKIDPARSESHEVRGERVEARHVTPTPQSPSGNLFKFRSK